MPAPKTIHVYDDIPPSTRICLYGTGKYGKDVLERLEIYRPDIKIPFLIDSFYSGHKYGFEVIKPESLVNGKMDDFDYILITSSFTEQILETLNSLKVDSILITSRNFFARNVIETLLRKDKGSNYFTSFVIGLTNKCNMSCKFCESTINPRIKNNRSKQLMDFSLFKQLIDEISHHKMTNHIELVGSGEPLLYPHLLEAIAYCKDKDFLTTTFTNGLLIDTHTYHKLIKAGLDRLFISLHNLSENSFRYRHATMNFDKYFSQIFSPIEYHAKMGISSEIVIRLMFAKKDLLATNLWQLPKIQEDTENTLNLIDPFITKIKLIARQNKIPCYLDKKTFVSYFNKLHHSDCSQVFEILPNIKLDLMFLVPPTPNNLCHIKKTNFSSKISFITSAPEGFCDTIDRPVITYDGTILACCGREEIKIGKIDNYNNIMSLLNHHDYQNILKGFLNNKLIHPSCRVCKGSYTLIDKQAKYRKHPIKTIFPFS